MNGNLFSKSRLAKIVGGVAKGCAVVLAILVVSFPQSRAQDMDHLIIPEVQFTNDTVQQALDVLKKDAADQGVKINFVSKVPADANGARISLTLEKVPVTEALRYLCQLTNTKFEVTADGVVVEPK
jgi:hydrogenase maturation factor